MPTPDDALDGGQWDIFVSYARQDDELTRKLIDALAADGRSCWVDWQDIRAAADWMEEIRAAIDGTQAFVFVVSPDSARSSVCRRELDYAAEGNKRILPVVAREPGDIDLPEVVGQRHWIFLRPGDDFDEGVRQLEGALDTEPEWAATHTRLLVRAREWERSGRDSSFLLRGSDLRAAEDWLSRSEGPKDPRPTSLHTEHVIASRRAVTRGQRIRTAALGAGLLIAAVLTLIAVGQRNRAEDQARVARSGELAARALLTAKTRPVDALAIADEAVRTEPTDQATQALRQTLEQTASTAAVIRGAGGKINGVALDPTGRLVAVAADRGAVTIWSRRGKLKDQLDTGAEGAKSLSFSADGKRLAIALGKGGVQVWDLGAKRLEDRIPTPRAVDSVAISRDGRSVAAGGVGGASVWRVADPEPVALIGERRLVYSVAFSPEGKRIITGGRSGVARVFTAQEGRLVQTLDVSGGGSSVDVNGVGFSPNGRQAITADQNGRAIVWDLNEARASSTVRASRDEVTSAVLSRDGHRLLTAGYDNDARVWDLGGGKPRLVMTLKGHEGAITNGAFSLDGRVAVTGSADGTARIWNTEPDDAISTFPTGPALAISYDSAGRQLLTAGATAEVWNAHEKRTARLMMPASIPAALDAEFSADGRRAVTTDFGPRVRIWDLASAGQVASLRGPAGTYPQGAEFTPDGKQIVAAYDDGTIRVSDAEHRTTISQFKAPATVRSIDLSPDGSMLAAGSDSGPVWILNLGTQELVATLRGHTDYVGSVRFSADGTRLASASDDRTAIVWDVASGVALATLTGHTAPVSDADFSPDSTQVVTSSEDNTVRVWETESGNPLETLDGFPDFVYGVDYSPDGESIAAVGISNVARIFECDLCTDADSLLSLAEERLEATLTSEERADALPG